MLTSAFKTYFNDHSVVQTASEVLVHDGLSKPLVSVSRVKQYQFEVFEQLSEDDMQVVLEYSSTPINERDYHAIDVGPIIKIDDKGIKTIADIDTKPFTKGDEDTLFLSHEQSQEVVSLAKIFKRTLRYENGD